MTFLSCIEMFYQHSKCSRSQDMSFSFVSVGVLNPVFYSGFFVHACQYQSLCLFTICKHYLRLIGNYSKFSVLSVIQKIAQNEPYEMRSENNVQRQQGKTFLSVFLVFSMTSPVIVAVWMPHGSDQITRSLKGRRWSNSAQYNSNN